MTSSTAIPYLNSKISLISRALIRYEGILVNIDTTDQTVGLINVRCFGTEDRVVGADAVPPSNDIFEFIIFQGKQIKDVTVSELVGPDDPAIVAINPSANQHSHPNTSQAGSSLDAATSQMMRHTSVLGGIQNGRNNDQSTGHFPCMMGHEMSNPSAVMNSLQMDYPYERNGSRSQFDYTNGRNRGGHHMPYANGNSMYVLPNRRPDHGGYAYHRNPNHRHLQHVIGELNPQPNSTLKSRVEKAFNFEEANSKFDKSAIEQDVVAAAASIGDEDGKGQQTNTNVLPEIKPVYDNKSSFFDNISCDALDRQNGSRVKIDRSKQRQIDIETFGSTGRQARIGRMNGRMPNRSSNLSGYYRRGMYNTASLMPIDVQMMGMAGPQYGQVGPIHRYQKNSMPRY